MYGANRSLVDLIKGIRKIDAHFQPVVIVPQKGALTEMLNKLSVPVIIIPFYNCIVDESSNKITAFAKSVIKSSLNRFLLRKHAGRIKKINPDIIHSNTSVFVWGIWLASILKKPHVQHIREFGKEDYNFSYEFGLRWYNRLLNKSKIIIAISKSIYQKRVSQSSAPIKKIVYNGIVFSDSLLEIEKEIIKNNKSANSCFSFGIMGNISKQKGQYQAIEALHLLQKDLNINTNLIIAGTCEDDYISVLKKEINKYELNNVVTFVGFIEDIKSFYQQIDCLLMCSENEALGRVTIEAMSFGIPVIGYENAGTAEIIVNDYNGLLYKKGSDDLSKAMRRIVNNKTLANTLQENGLKTVTENFTIEKYAQSVYDLYLLN